MIYIMIIAIFISLIALGFSILVVIGNLSAMKLLAKNGVAVFCKDIVKDYKLLDYVNKEGIGWLFVPEVCYAPVMKYVNGKYNNHNFLQKSNMYGEIYVTEGDSAKLLQSISIESDNDIKDLTIIRGSAKGNSSELRHSNFLNLSRCSGLLNERKVVQLCDKGVVRNFDIVAVLDMTLGERHEFKYSSRKEFLDSLLHIAKVKSINEISNDNQVILLQCKTEIDTIMVVLLEKEEGV